MRSGAAAAALALGGCLTDGRQGTPTDGTDGTTRPPTTPGSGAGTDDPTATATDTTERPTYTRASTRSLHLDPVSPADVAGRVLVDVEDLSGREREALRTMQSDGGYRLTDVVFHDRLLFQGDPFVRLDGTIYRVRERVTAERDRVVHRFHVELVSGSRSDAVAFEDLSATDRAVFRESLTEEYLENGTPFAGTFFYSFGNESTARGSRFVHDPTAVTFQGDTFVLEFLRRDRVTVTDLEYGLAEVASDREGFHEYLVAEYVRPLSELALSDEQLAIVRAAVEGDRYREEMPLSEPFRDLLDTLDTLPAVPGGGRYVRYDGTIYHVVETGVDV